MSTFAHERIAFYLQATNSLYIILCIFLSIVAIEREVEHICDV